MRRIKLSEAAHEPFPLAYVLSAARDDAQAQQEISELTREAVVLVLDLVERVGAWDEELPRGYSVRRVPARPNRQRGPKSERHELRHTASNFWGNGATTKIAERDADGMRLCSDVLFVNHIKEGLMHEFGAYFVERCRHAQAERQALETSLKDVRLMRHILLEDPSLDDGLSDDNT